MISTRLVQILAALVMVTCLAGVSFKLVPRLVEERNRIMPPLDREKIATLAPSATVANAALTVFRGVAVDILWYQANKLKEEGRYFDANDKAELITTLQPRFPKVWAFHAWNMAYNISVATYTPEERWDWVNKGINLLRERGIPNNPMSVILYKELGWIFGHKVGQYSDDMHWFYKRNLAQEWQEVLPPNDGLSKADAIKQFEPIAKAPKKLETLLAEKPEVAPLLELLKQCREPQKPNESLLRRINRLQMFTGAKTASLLGYRLEQFPQLFDETDRDLVRIITDPRNGPAVGALIAFLRRSVIENRYHMSPERMLEFMDLFGPLDFRHPAAHATYWATMGTKVTEAGMPPGEIDLLNTYRGSIHGLQALMFQGRVNYDPITRKLDYLPDPRFIVAYEKALELTRAATSQPAIFDGAKDSFDAGYENFLLIAVVYSYLYGEEDQAAEYYAKIRKLFGKKDDNIRMQRYSVPLEELVLKEMTDTIDILSHARQAIDGFLLQAFKQGLRNDRREVYDKFVKLAQYVHTTFNQKATATPLADQKRMSLLPFPQIIEESMLAYLRDEADPFDRARVWAAAGGISELADARYSIFDKIGEGAREQAKQMNLNPDLAFPEPPGFKAWAAVHRPKSKTKITGETTNASGTPAAVGRIDADAAGTGNRPPTNDDSVRVERK